MLIHHNILHRLWGDGVLTGCYLINRMPSTDLQRKVPYQIILSWHTTFTIPPTNFGYVMCTTLSLLLIKLILMVEDFLREIIQIPRRISMLFPWSKDIASFS